jgi:hypothetical protein
MQIIMAVLSLALLILVEPASAQTSAQSATYSASVSVHNDLTQPPLQLNPDQVNGILDRASKMLKKNNLAHPESDNDVKCNVTFALNGSIGTFSDPPNAIVNKDNIDAVMNHNLGADANFHIKVVRKIEYCRPGVDTSQAGCAFSPPHYRTAIVVHPQILAQILGGPFPDHLLWAHEFGHLTGLPHREDSKEPGAPDDKSALMTRCNLKMQFSGMDDTQVQVSRHECRRLLAGPGRRSPGPFKNPMEDCRN